MDPLSPFSRLPNDLISIIIDDIDNIGSFSLVEKRLASVVEEWFKKKNKEIMASNLPLNKIFDAEMNDWSPKKLFMHFANHLQDYAKSIGCKKVRIIPKDLTRPIDKINQECEQFKTLFTHLNLLYIKWLNSSLVPIVDKKETKEKNICHFTQVFAELQTKKYAESNKIHINYEWLKLGCFYSKIYQNDKFQQKYLARELFKEFLKSDAKIIGEETCEGPFTAHDIDQWKEY